MRIEYEPNLVEQSVLFAARQDAALMGQLHGATDPLYQLTDATQQESRFRETYAGFFRRLKLDEVLPHLSRSAAASLDRQRIPARKPLNCM